MREFKEKRGGSEARASIQGILEELGGSGGRGEERGGGGVQGKLCSRRSKAMESLRQDRKEGGCLQEATQGGGGGGVVRARRRTVVQMMMAERS